MDCIKKFINSKEMKKLLRANGYTLVRQKGDHCIFKNDIKTVVVNDDLNRMVCQRILKETGLKNQITN